MSEKFEQAWPERHQHPWTLPENVVRTCIASGLHMVGQLQRDQQTKLKMWMFDRMYVATLQFQDRKANTAFQLFNHALLDALIHTYPCTLFKSKNTHHLLAIWTPGGTPAVCATWQYNLDTSRDNRINRHLDPNYDKCTRQEHVYVTA